MRVLALGEVAAAGSALDPIAYSRYKYGHTAAVDAFAADLARLVTAELPELTAASATVTAPASRAVPIGADLLADGVLRHLNRMRAQRRVEPAVRPKLHRYHVPAGDYGSQDLTARQAVLAAERISSIPELFAGRHVVVVDDLWVTGTSARVTAAAIERWRPESLTYLVIATVEAGFAQRHPQIESELNHAAVDGLPALAELSRDGPMVINQRVCKFVLSEPAGRLAAWLDGVAPEFVWRLHTAVLAEGFGLMPASRDNAALLSGYVDEHRLEEHAARCGWSPVG